MSHFESQQINATLFLPSCFWFLLSDFSFVYCPRMSPRLFSLAAFALILPFAGLFTGCGKGARMPGEVPDVSLLTYEGLPYTISRKDKAVTLIVFWATWCQPCLEEIPELVRLQNTYGKKGFRVVGINIDDPEGIQALPLAARLGVNYPLLIEDAATEAAFGGLRALPTSFLVGRDGKLKKKLEGLYPAEKVEEMVRAQL